jgi:hypothetical protein
MSNTIIQIKRSTTTGTPPGGSLANAELAYSYVSNKLFIGSANGLDVIAIGGKYFIDQANAAYDVSNAAYTVLNAAYTSANANYVVTNAAFDVANAAWTMLNTAFTTTNAAFTMTNANFTVTNAAYTLANANFNVTNAAYTSSNAGYTVANAAFDLANTKFASAGGVVSGDVAITGNLVVSGETTYTNTNTLLVGDNIFVLNADVPNNVVATENAGMEINRGSSATVGLIWNEANTNWTFTNDGTVYQSIVGNTRIEAVIANLNSNYATTNAAFGVINAAYTSANANYVVTNAAFEVLNAAYTSANANYVVTNAAYVAVNAAYVVVNAAYTSVNAAYVVANAAFDTANVADQHAANASYMNTGTVPSALVTGNYNGITGVGTLTSGTWQADTVQVLYGGTGRTTFTTNGVLFGNSTGGLLVTSAGTEGTVLQADSFGVPHFAHLDGGGF